MYVVDHDPSMRNNLQTLISSLQVGIETFPTAADFLQAFDCRNRACLIADICLPDMHSVELIQQLKSRDCAIPTIVLAAGGNVSDAVRAIRAGAVDCLEKPPSRSALLKRIIQVLRLETTL